MKPLPHEGQRSNQSDTALDAVIIAPASMMIVPNMWALPKVLFSGTRKKA